jgi:hypothetical protein
MKRFSPSRVSVLAATFGAVVVIGASAPTPAEALEPACPVSDVDYSVVGNLLLKDTKFGAADGVYPFGSGTVRVRFQNGENGAPAVASLMSYEFDSRYTVHASFAAWSTTVVAESHTTVARECEGAARGTVQNGDVVWQTPVDGYRSDGSLACTGNVCGIFGAPPPGSSPLHDAPPSVKLSPFHFGPDGKTFTMPYARISHSDSPRQTSYMSLAGRELRRACVPAALSCG